MSAMLPNATCVHRRLWNISNMRALLFHALLNSADGFVAPFHASAEYADPIANGKQQVKPLWRQRIGILGFVLLPIKLDGFERGEFARKLSAQAGEKAECL